MNPKAWLIPLALSASACDRQGYVAITVKLGTLAGRVDRLELQAFDARGDAGPMLIPAAGPEPQGIPNNSVIAVATPQGNDPDQIMVERDWSGDGGSIRRWAQRHGPPRQPPTPAFRSPSRTPCTSQRDCDPSAVCLGTEVCALGTCQAATLPIADAGAPCGPSDGGRCNGIGTCILPYCGTGLRPLPPDEQCDEGAAQNGNLPDHCRTDCRLPSCGDGIVDPDAGEICDLAAVNGTGVGCNATCNLHGTASILAGNGEAASLDGVGQDAGFDNPGPLAVIGTDLYVADELSHLIRRIDLHLAGGHDHRGRLRRRRLP